jgi:2,3-bisphosphoglycerate-dependent phosphoglycerate mutase
MKNLITTTTSGTGIGTGTGKGDSMSQLILLRHGQSEWNKRNLFTGWVDVPLSPEGINEAFAAGKAISDIPIDVIITTTLVRAQMTAFLAMSKHHSKKVPVVMHPGEGRMDAWSKIHSEKTKSEIIPVYYTSELNERAYGELQGLNKTETAEKFGADQVKLWRRSFDVPPPNGESLSMTAERSIPYFEQTIVPMLEDHKNVFVCAHGNSLRSIIMQLDGLTIDEVLHLELATGIPVIYDFSNGEFIKRSSD